VWNNILPNGILADTLRFHVNLSALGGTAVASCAVNRLWQPVIRLWSMWPSVVYWRTMDHSACVVIIRDHRRHIAYVHQRQLLVTSWKYRSPIDNANYVAEWRRYASPVQLWSSRENIDKLELLSHITRNRFFRNWHLLGGDTDVSLINDFSQSCMCLCHRCKPITVSSNAPGWWQRSHTAFSNYHRQTSVIENQIIRTANIVITTDSHISNSHESNQTSRPADGLCIQVIRTGALSMTSVPGNVWE